MAARKHKLAIGVFHDTTAAQAAVNDLVEAGFTDEQIGVVARNGDGSTKTTKGRKKDTGTKVEEGAVTGVAAGAGIGALWALGIAVGMLPAIGPVIAGGLFASVLASAAGGAAVAGIVGALVGLGIPEEEALYYEQEFKAGRTLVTVQANGRYNEAMEILRRHGSYTREQAIQPTSTNLITSASEGPTDSTVRTGRGLAAATGTEEQAGTVELREEKAHVRKKPVKKGEVRVSKEVVTDQKTVAVPVEHEEVVIERRPARRKGSAKKIDATCATEEIRIPVSEEQVHVDKEVVVKEEVGVGKRKVHDTETVTTDVKHEELKVEQEGQARVRRRKD